MNVLSPVWVQSDGTLLLDERQPGFEEARERLRQWAELSKRPGFIHTYRLTPVSLWNAAASGWTAERVLQTLRPLARFDIPAAVEAEIRRQMGRYGALKLRSEGGGLVLEADTNERLAEVARLPEWRIWSLGPCGERTARVRPEARGRLKRELAARGYPVLDEAGYRRGETLRIALREEAVLRPYQREAVDAFFGEGLGGGSGIVVLPCGAGKTWVGMAALARLGCETLILTPNGVSVSQWIRELLRHTTLTENEIGEYTGRAKQVRPVTVATYQVLTHRSSKEGPYPHWKLFEGRNWGLIIYDEAHLLPAPVFRMTADLQATRRLGLTATLVREDGREGDAFALIGPKRYDLPWKAVEQAGWIAEAACVEIRVPMDERTAARYRSAPPASRYRIAGENPRKTEVVRELIARHEGEPILVIGQYLDQLRTLARALSLPLITGEMPYAERCRWFDRFNRGEIRALAVSKVANFAVDLPDARVAIQISGSYGSRQEEAQRLGRILRPKAGGESAKFYSLVALETDEIEFARKRKLFLLEQGYSYRVEIWGMGGQGAEEKDRFACPPERSEA